MKIWMGVFALCNCFSLVWGRESKEKVPQYLQFIEKHKDVLGSFGNYKKGEIQVVTDLKLIAEIQEVHKVRCQQRGLAEKDALNASRIGILSDDSYWILVRDAVIFPTGAYGVYNRLILKSSLANNEGIAGVAVLPRLEDGRFALIIAYRHATRSWELEIPRGGKPDKETLEDAAKRELEEETGLIATDIKPLGTMAIDPGVTSALNAIFLGTVKKKGIANQDFSEAILRWEPFTLKELKDAFSQGFVMLDINGVKQKVHMRDPFLAYALFQAENKKLLP